MDLHKTLTEIGLTEKEAKIYIALLELKEALPGAISKHSDIKRPTTYVILDQLLEKGVIKKVQKDALTLFTPEDPKFLLDRQHQKLEKLKTAIPDLQKLHKKYTTTPTTKIFEGTAGLIEIMEDTLTSKTEILCWTDIEKSVATLRDYYPTYIEKKVQRKIFLRGIFSESDLAHRFKKFEKQELREVHIVPRNKFQFKNEIRIYDDKVAIISHTDMIGTIIKNPATADTLRSIFEMGWEYSALLENH